MMQPLYKEDDMRKRNNTRASYERGYGHPDHNALTLENRLPTLTPHTRKKHANSSTSGLSQHTHKCMGKPSGLLVKSAVCERASEVREDTSAAPNFFRIANRSTSSWILFDDCGFTKYDETDGSRAKASSSVASTLDPGSTF